MNYLSQIVGIIAFIFFVSSIQLKNKKKLLLFQLLANLFYALQYILLNVFVAGGMNILSTIRCLILYFYDKKKKEPSKILLWVFIVIIITIGILTYSNYLSIIPIGITLLYTISTWQDDMQSIRILFVIAAIFWVIYNISVGAYTALIGNAFEITSGIISIIRYNKKNTITK